jgi:acetate kinase
MPDPVAGSGAAPRSFIAVNAGSSSIKFSLLAGRSSDTLAAIAHGEIEGIATAPHFFAKDMQGRLLVDQHWDSGTSYDDLLADLISWIETHLGPNRLTAAGHRVAHGGPAYHGPQLVTPAVLAGLRALEPWAPLHQPHNLAPIDALARRNPGLPQVACFDTSFHATNPRISRLYGLPADLAGEGVLRYGFHGLSYEYIAGELPRFEPRARDGRVIVAHLGSGASLCALVGSKSVASTMGFSALDGLPMGTRCGALDPGVLLFLLQQKGMSAEALEALLYRQSGLLGVSGISSDVRELLASSNAGAREAIELFAYRCAREIGSLAAAAGGLDALVFTAGIGEHAARIRALICDQCTWLGIRLDALSNDEGGPRISAVGSPVSIWVIPTNEELMVARHTFALTSPS